MNQYVVRDLISRILHIFLEPWHLWNIYRYENNLSYGELLTAMSICYQTGT